MGVQGHARVVDQHVDAALAGQGLLDHLLREGPIAQVPRPVTAHGCLGATRLHEGSQLRLAPGHRHQPTAPLRKSLREGATDSRGGTGNHHHRVAVPQGRAAPAP